MKIAVPNDPRDSRHSKLKPINLRLWRMVVLQARMKYEHYPSPAASAWVHRKYVESGGKFLSTDDPRYKKIIGKEKEITEKADAKAGIHKSKKDQEEEDRGKK